MGSQTYDIEISSSCWQLLATDETDINKIQREIDAAFSGYSFYPEVDWKKYGYRPPDGYDVLGAWRHPETMVFAFLLDNSVTKRKGRNSQFLLYVVGDDSELAVIERKIVSLKKGLTKQAVRASESIGAAYRLDQMTPNRSIGMFTAVLTFVTGLVNVYSHYLRTLPPPDLGTDSLKLAYVVLLGVVHFLSLGLLILVTLICALFLLKYAYVLLKRL